MGDIRQALSDRILILDGAMGTMLQRHGLEGNSETFNLSNPETIKEIHNDYIAAGADIITTNSFSANRISQAEYGLSDRASVFAEAAARLAREAADAAPRKVWVAGSVGPTGKSLSLAQDINNPAFRPYGFDRMADAFEEQIRALIAGGVDLLLFETCFDALNTKAAIYALSRIADIPVMISASLSDRSGRSLTGQTMEAFYRSITHADPLSFGLNCSLGGKDMIPLVAEVSRFAGCAVSCYPNAGLPNEMGQYDESPEETAAAIREMAIAGSVNIVGGCCGTTPDHIRAIADAVRGIKPRAMEPLPAMASGSVKPLVLEQGPLYVSGLESVEVDRKNNFTNVGERTNVAGSRKFAKLIAAGEYETGLQIAAQQIENGASVIDINMDDAMLDSTVEMEKFLRYVSNDPSVAKAALMIDSSHWETLVTGLKNAQGKCIVNSISLKEGEDIFLRKAKEIKTLGAAVIVIAFDEKGQATSFDRKIEICRRAYRLLTEKAGYSATDIIFDVNVLPVGTGIAEHARYGADFIEAVRWIKDNLPGCRTSGGISNLSFSFRGNNTVREAMHSVFLYHAIAAGLDMGIVNPGMLQVYDDIEPELMKRCEDVILDSDPGATERLIDKAQRIAEAAAAAKAAAECGQSLAIGGMERSGASGGPMSPSADLTVQERIVNALVKGDSSNLETDLKECLKIYSRPVEIIDGPLMSGMAKVGELFGAGKMFLPQVVKSARTMKNAVAVLQPYIEEGSEKGISKPKIVFATVKGDVHDIGKNITGIVLGCNGFEIIDLGVMVPKETILDAAGKNEADLIGVSGLITPSLFQMEEICREMQARRLSTPLLVGGAAASALHTAVKLAPLYEHVFYASDASASAVLASQLMSDREETERIEHEKQEKLRILYAEGGKKRPGRTENNTPESGAAASEPDGKPVFSEGEYISGNPFENIPARGLSIAEVESFFDWSLFTTIWGLKKPSEADAGVMETYSRELQRIRKDAEDELKRLKASNGCIITISARFDGARSEGDDIVAKDFRLPMFRNNEGRSLSDFVAPKQYGFDSPMGMFAISVHPVEHQAPCDCPVCSGISTGDYSSMLSRAVRLTLAEAASEWLSAEIASRLSAVSNFPLKPVKTKDEAMLCIIKPAAGYASCPDHTLKRDILRLLPGAGKLRITLLDSCAMIPDATICGLIFIHPEASYPEVRRLSQSAIDEYASRRGMSEAEKHQFLGNLL